MNRTISLSICQKYGLIKFFFRENKLNKPFLLPHSQPRPSSKLVENDMSDASISIPRLSKNSIILGYVTCQGNAIVIPNSKRNCIVYTTRANKHHEQIVHSRVLNSTLFEQVTHSRERDALHCTYQLHKPLHLIKTYLEQLMKIPLRIVRRRFVLKDEANEISFSDTSR